MAYSVVVDVAGHLHKHADVNGVLISEDRLDALPKGLPFDAVGALEGHASAACRLAKPLP